MAKDSADLLLDLINDILDFSKIEAGQLELEDIDFNLHEVVEAVSDVIIQQIENKGLELNLFVKPDVPQFIIGDPTRLRQVLTNLVSNALKFNEKGEINIIVDIDKNKQKDCPDNSSVNLVFGVKDTGLGIPEARQQAIFESFSQADSSTTRRFGGTGLGLSICKQLVNLMQGDIWVESEFGKGSTFFFTACFSDSKKNNNVLFKLPEKLHNLRVLAVDDNETNRVIIRETLKAYGFVSDIFEFPKEALEFFRSKAKGYFNLIITDFQCLI